MSGEHEVIMTPHMPGSVEVICGSMFSGKTDELIRRLRRATIARQHVQVFKPAIDVRYAVEKVTSHAGTDYAAIPVEKAADIRQRLDKEATVVAIDEAQFFDDEIIQVVEELAAKQDACHRGRIGYGFSRRTIRSDAVLMARAEHVDKIQAICMVCGEPASRTQRLVNGKPARYDDPVVIVGAAEMYEARCRTHHEVPR